MDFADKISQLMGNALLSKALYLVLVLAAGMLVIRIVVHLLRKSLGKSSLDGALHSFIINFARVVMWTVLAVTLLSVLGIPTTTFITVIGACAAAVALALKDSLSNFAGGILIIVNKPFEKGDYIEACGIGGRVNEINLFYSKLTTLDNKIISIPNGKLSGDVVVNFSRADLRRVDCTFSIGYAANIDEAKKIIMRVIGDTKLFVSDPKPVVGVSAHGENAVEIETLAWCKTEDYFDAKYYLYEQVKESFDKSGIEIPFPQVVVHLMPSRRRRAERRKTRKTTRRGTLISRAWSILPEQEKSEADGARNAAKPGAERSAGKTGSKGDETTAKK